MLRVLAIVVGAWVLCMVFVVAMCKTAADGEKRVQEGMDWWLWENEMTMKRKGKP